MIKRKAVVAATVTAAAALITLAACTWMPMAYASETTADEATETYHVYTVSITVDGKEYSDVTCDDTRTIWDFVNEIGINDTNDTNITLRDENSDEVSRDTLLKDVSGQTLTLEAKSFYTPKPDNENVSKTATDTNSKETNAEDKKTYTITIIRAGNTDIQKTVNIQDGETYREAFERLQASGDRYWDSLLDGTPGADGKEELTKQVYDKHWQIKEYQHIDIDQPYKEEDGTFFYLTYNYKLEVTVAIKFYDDVFNNGSNLLRDPEYGPETPYQTVKATWDNLTYTLTFRNLDNINLKTSYKPKYYRFEISDAYTSSYTDPPTAISLDTDPENMKFTKNEQTAIVNIDQSITSNMVLTVYAYPGTQIAVANADGHGGLKYLYAPGDDIATIKGNDGFAETYQLDTSEITDPNECHRLVKFQYLDFDDPDMHTYGGDTTNEMVNAARSGKLAEYLNEKDDRTWRDYDTEQYPFDLSKPNLYLASQMQVGKGGGPGVVRAVWEKVPEETPKTPENTTTEETPNTPEKPQQETVETVKNAPKTTEEETEETPKREIVQTGIDNITWAAITAGVAVVAGAGVLIFKTIAKRHL